ncbi:hypothetical protein HanRHA438_Chr04g0164701 [Helianthus annuus]|nr:hypothetical protein HanRHA438_Chr04g0164701 [Helianthus annuus]
MVVGEDQIWVCFRKGLCTPRVWDRESRSCIVAVKPSVLCSKIYGPSSAVKRKFCESCYNYSGPRIPETR